MVTKYEFTLAWHSHFFFFHSKKEQNKTLLIDSIWNKLTSQQTFLEFTGLFPGIFIVWGLRFLALYRCSEILALTSGAHQL